MSHLLSLKIELPFGTQSARHDVQSCREAPIPGQNGRRTQPQRRAETETRLLEAATTLIAARGSRAVSLAEVGRLAGYSSGIVSHHFGGKQQLLAALVEYAQHFEVPPTAGCGIVQLAALVSAYLENLRDGSPAGQAFLLLWAESVAGESALIELFAERDTWFRTLLAQHIRDGIDDGSVRSDAEPEALAVTLLGLLRGIGMQLMSTAAHIPLDSLAAQAVGLILHGIRVPGSAGGAADRAGVF